MSEHQDIILEDTRVSENEDFEKINKLYNSTCTKKYAKVLDWKNELFWKDLPNPKNNSFNKKIKASKSEYVSIQTLDSLFGDVLPKLLDNKPTTMKLNDETKYLLQKYFNIWKNAVLLKRDLVKERENEQNQQLKLEALIKKLKKRNRKNEKLKKLEDSKSDESFLEKPKHIFKETSTIYKNRYDAQKTIIQMQKAKLEEQSKIIQDLKVGIISDDLLKSIENTKTNIREIFGNCSTKIKYKIPLILSDESRFLVNSHRVPKIVQKLEHRALERAQNREMILERKRIIEEARQKMLQEAIEKKRVLEEEEKRRSLELMKERRQKELEAEKIRQANKQKYMEKLNKAVGFHNKLLLKQNLRKLFKNILIARKNNFVAVEHYQHKTMKKCFDNWQILVESTYKLKYQKADAHFEYVLLRTSLKIWQKVRFESIRNMQVAEDFFDFRLTSNIFIHWNRYVCIQYMREHKNLKIAETHFKRRLLFHYFYLWRSLKTVNELEKAKELKKAKWRSKVWEILPDYKPPEDF
ncbi:merozoite surface protein 9 [Diorhabda sublineata]|uniref:merozoite surface protein 9 n=1 Tax=Diorhabda sublineata TaxID=1163346 RepID=UPI0024E08C61|nr:merozoite surface protein 9 [Diorhabda sublineata]